MSFFLILQKQGMRKLWASKLGTPRPLPCSGYEGKATGTVLDDGPAFGLQ